MPPPQPAPENFVQILERVWWRLDRALEPASLRAAARLYLAEAALAGTTALIDHHESPNLIEGSLELLAEAAQELGLRVVLCYGATERNGGLAEARAGLDACRRWIGRCDGSSLLRGAVALHASFTVSDQTIREAGELCRQLGAVLHLHLAEDRADVEDARRRGFAGPLQRLIALDALPAGSILAHGVHLEAGDVAEIAARGCWLVQNPRSNRGNRVGYPRFLASSDRVALGTDGYPAAMGEEAAVLEALAREHDDGAWRPRLEGGHRLLGELFGERFALLGPGGAGDLVAREPDGRVRHVVVAGQVVIRDGRLVTAEIDAIRAEAREQAERLWQQMAKLG
jgi:cytosine/adenosine deaminase-related metal-dependent hydrolase